MTLSRTAPLQSLSAAPVLPGTWKLVAGRAVTLRPAEAAILRVSHGRIWATFDGPHAGPANARGDQVFEVGDSVRVEAGQRVVIESWQRDGASYFAWDPAPALAREPALSWRVVAQPLADLRLAVLLGAGAFGRLLAGLGRLAWDAAAPRRRPVAGAVQCKA